MTPDSVGPDAPGLVPDSAATAAIDTPDAHIAEALRHYQALHSNTFEGERWIDDPTRHYLAVSAQCSDFGLAFLMEALRRVAPEVADRAAKELWSIYDAGDAAGEIAWSWQRAREGVEDSRAWFERWLLRVLNGEPTDG